MDEPNRTGSSSSDDDQPPAPALAERAPLLDLIDGDGSLGPADLAWLRERASHALVLLGARGEVRVRLAGDAEMADAHGRYAGVAGVTDVLTFDLAGGSGSGVLDADILVCVDEARRQALARGHAVGREALLYIVHGVLHCLGHDDHDDDGFERMHAREDDLLGRLGVGATFGRDESGAGGVR